MSVTTSKELPTKGKSLLKKAKKSKVQTEIKMWPWKMWIWWIITASSSTLIPSPNKSNNVAIKGIQSADKRCRVFKGPQHHWIQFADRNSLRQFSLTIHSQQVDISIFWTHQQQTDCESKQTLNLLFWSHWHLKRIHNC